MLGKGLEGVMKGGKGWMGRTDEFCFMNGIMDFD